VNKGHPPKGPLDGPVFSDGHLLVDMVISESVEEQILDGVVGEHEYHRGLSCQFPSSYQSIKSRSRSNSFCNSRCNFLVFRVIRFRCDVAAEFLDVIQGERHMHLAAACVSGSESVGQFQIGKGVIKNQRAFAEGECGKRNGPPVIRCER